MSADALSSFPDSLTANFKAVRFDEAGHFFAKPGATISIRQVNPKATKQIMANGPSFSPKEARIRVNLAPGTYELGLQVPDGYSASYASCLKCKVSETARYIPYGPYNRRRIVFVVTGASKYHFDIHYTAIAVYCKPAKTATNVPPECCKMPRVI